MTELEDRWRDLGEFIREQRRIGQLSLRKLSEMAGISNPYLSQIERGLRKPSAEILRQIAQALHISAESLYVRAGILEERDGIVDVVAEIRRDPVLNDEQKKTLVHIYQSFRTDQQVLIDAELAALDLSDDALADLDLLAGRDAVDCPAAPETAAEVAPGVAKGDAGDDGAAAQVGVAPEGGPELPAVGSEGRSATDGPGATTDPPAAAGVAPPALVPAEAPGDATSGPPASPVLATGGARAPTPAESVVLPKDPAAAARDRSATTAAAVTTPDPGAVAEGDHSLAR